jgi:hypothetical protein
VSGAPGFGGFADRGASPVWTPTQIPQLTKWLSWAGATSSGTFSLPDKLGGAAATQASAGLKPVINRTANGIAYGTFSNSLLALPLSPAINDNLLFGVAFWLRLANLSGVKTLMSVQSVPGGASANKLLVDTFGASLEARAQAVDRRALLTSMSLDTNWRFCYTGIDCSKPSEPAQVIMGLDGVFGTVAFSSDTAWPASLGTPTGNMFIGATLVDGTGSPLFADVGDVYHFSGQVSASDFGRLKNFDRPL